MTPRRGLPLVLAIGLVAQLAGCGDLPRPFAGDPGATALRLAQPPPARLAIAPPNDALLPDDATKVYADAVVTAMLVREVPAVAEPARKGDWRLDLGATLRGDKVVPSFTVDDPAGKQMGTEDGAPVDAAAWSEGRPATLQQVADAAGPTIATLLTRIEATRRLSDPTSLLNRPSRVLVMPVTGAPGDGDEQLTKQIKRLLPELGDMVLETPAGADFTVTGMVRTAPAPGTEQTRVEIQWLVIDTYKREIGHVVQLNDVPTNAIIPYWGDIAVAAAREAAGGVHDILTKQKELPPGVTRPPATPEAAAGAPAAGAPAAGIPAAPPPAQP